MQRRGKLWSVTISKKQCKERVGFGMLQLPKKKRREREKELLVNDGGWSFQQWTHSGIVKCT